MSAGVNAASQADNAAVTPASSANRNRAAIAQNFDAFLLLLTTQLRNQSPLDPLDTNQFTQQLVQFATVEQQIKSNDTLDALLTSARAANIATAASFVGMRVQAEGTTAALRDGQASWKVDFARDSARATIEIADERGNVVAVETRAFGAGPQVYTWNGTTSTGQVAPEGAYTIKVNARDVRGQPVIVDTMVDGIVDSLDLSGGEPVLQVGATRIQLSNVKGVTRP